MLMLMLMMIQPFLQPQFSVKLFYELFRRLVNMKLFLLFCLPRQSCHLHAPPFIAATHLHLPATILLGRRQKLPPTTAGATARETRWTATTTELILQR